MDQNPDARRDPDPLAMTRIVLRPSGNPLPLGFTALAMGTVGFSAIQLGIVGTAEESTVALATLVLTVPLQFYASVVGFGARDPIAGNGMAIVAGVWAMLAATTLASPPGSSSPAVGILLLTAAIAMIAPALAARGKLLAAFIMVGSSLRFATTGLADLTELQAWDTAAGILGFALAALALYAALGFALEEANHPVKLPLLRRGEGRKPLKDDIATQVEGIAREAGVRQQL